MINKVKEYGNGKYSLKVINNNIEKIYYYDSEEECAIQYIDREISLHLNNSDISKEIRDRFSPKQLWNGNYMKMRNINGRMEPDYLYCTVELDHALKLFEEYTEKQIEWLDYAIKSKIIIIPEVYLKYYDEYISSDVYEKRKKLIYKDTSKRIAKLIQIKNPKQENETTNKNAITVIDKFINTFKNRKKAPTLKAGWTVYIIIMMCEFVLYNTIPLWVITSLTFFAWRRREIIKYNGRE